MLDDSAAQVVVVGAEFAETLARLQRSLPRVREVVVLGGDDDEYEKRLDAAEPVIEPHESTSEDRFLVLYTSGTTGWPKGAMLTPRSMTAQTRVVAPAYAMDGNTINIVATPLFHVGGTSWALAGVARAAARSSSGSRFPAPCSISSNPGRRHTRTSPPR